MNRKTIYLTFNEGFFKPNETIEFDIECEFKAQVVGKPKRKWYLCLLEFITIGFYKAPWKYKVKIIDNE